MYTDIHGSRVLSPLLLLAALACGQGEERVTLSGDEPLANDSAFDDGAADDIDEWVSGDAPSSCEKSAPVALATTALQGAAPACEPTTAARTFSRALCSCEDTSVAGFLHTRSFRSGQDAFGTTRLGGSVGVNHNYLTGGLADVGGSFIVSGSRDTLFGGLLKVGGDLSFRPAFDVAGLVDIGGDAHLAGSLRAVGLIGIHGDLHRSEDSRFLGVALVHVDGARFTAPVDVPLPCGCEPTERLDVAAAVDAARDDNDDSAIGLDPHALDLSVGIGTAITLPSGRFFVHQVGSLGAIRLRIAGRVALYVDDDFLAGPLFAVTLDPGAELDLFVRDDFALAGAAVLGDPARPAATRIYVGGSGDIAVAGLNAFAGNLYAPSANVLVGGVGKVYGSLFGKNILAAGFLDVGFDETIRDGVECSDAEPPPTLEPAPTDPSDPPTSDPHASDPPASDPPASDPPASDPSSDPPAHASPSDPPGNAPPRDETPANDPEPPASVDPPPGVSPNPCTPVVRAPH